MNKLPNLGLIQIYLFKNLIHDYWNEVYLHKFTILDARQNKPIILKCNNMNDIYLLYINIGNYLIICLLENSIRLSDGLNKKSLIR